MLRLQPNGDLRAIVKNTQVSLFGNLLYGVCYIPMKCSPYTICVPSSGNCLGVCTTDSGEDCTSHHHSSLSCTTNPAPTRMETLSGVTYFSIHNRPGVKVTSSQDCRDMCFNNCSCDVSFYVPKYSLCFLEKDVLQFTKESDNGYMAFIKMWVVDSSTPSIPPSVARGKSKRQVSVQVAIAVVATTFGLLFYVATSALLIHRKRSRSVDPESENDGSEDEFWHAFHASQTTKFSYKDIQSITANFAKKLGSGGFGFVYEGMLPNNNKLVAIKRLDGVSRQGTKEFRAEVATLANINIHHFHLVKLLDFCTQGSNKLLVYEHMPNGSLDAWIFGDLSLTWETRHRIAIGVAFGLAYLHEECDTKVIHLDIKPQNILLDENFVAKVGDFGMSRLMRRDESSAFTTMRGTPGYLAPEWLIHGVANEKMDVYSYGMVLLELISSRKNYDMQASDEDQRYLPAWALKKVMQGKELEILDSRLLTSLANDVDVKQLKTMIRVSFLCTHDDVQCRPRMSSIVKMLEGETPVPTNQQIASSLHPRIAESTIDDKSSSVVLVPR